MPRNVLRDLVTVTLIYCSYTYSASNTDTYLVWKATFIRSTNYLAVHFSFPPLNMLRITGVDLKSTIRTKRFMWNKSYIRSMSMKTHFVRLPN